MNQWCLPWAPMVGGLLAPVPWTRLPLAGRCDVHTGDGAGGGGRRITSVTQASVKYGEAIGLPVHQQRSPRGFCDSTSARSEARAWAHEDTAQCSSRRLIRLPGPR